MALLCCCWVPDADRFVSLLMGCQFGLEGVSTALLLAASLVTRILAAHEAATAKAVEELARAREEGGQGVRARHA